MPIQYGNMNPLNQVIPGIQAGLQMGAMFQKQPQQSNEAIMPDPGPPQQVKAIDLLQAEYQDVLKYDELNKKIKKIKNITPETRQRLMTNAVQTGLIKTPIVQFIVLNDDLIEPEEVIGVMKSIKNNDPESAFDLETLIIRLGGTDSPGGSAVATRLNEVKAKQDELNKSRKIILRTTINNILEYQEDPKEWVNKNGKLNPQAMKVIQNRDNYIKEYVQLGGGDELLNDIKKRTYKERAVDYQFQVWNPKTKSYETDEMTAESIQEVKAKTGAERVSPFSSNIGTSMFRESELEARRRNIWIRKNQKRLDKMPSPKRPGKKPSDKEAMQFLREFGDEAEQALRAKGYGTK